MHLLMDSYCHSLELMMRMNGGRTKKHEETEEEIRQNPMVLRDTFYLKSEFMRTIKVKARCTLKPILCYYKVLRVQKTTNTYVWGKSTPLMDDNCSVQTLLSIHKL